LRRGVPKTPRLWYDEFATDGLAVWKEVYPMNRQPDINFMALLEKWPDTAAQTILNRRLDVPTLTILYERLSQEDAYVKLRIKKSKFSESPYYKMRTHKGMKHQSHLCVNVAISSFLLIPKPYPQTAS
jgi:hypothetical protein